MSQLTYFWSKTMLLNHSPVQESQVSFKKSRLGNVLVSARIASKLNFQEASDTSYRHIAAASQVEQYWLWYDRGASLLNQQNYEEALTCFGWSIITASHRPEAWHAHGDTLANLMRYEEALESFNRAVALDQSRVKSWTFRAVVLIHLERYSEALESCDQALSLQSNDKEAWLLRGVSLQRLGRYREAYVSYDRANGTERRDFWQEVCQTWTGFSNLFRKNCVAH